MLRTMLRKSSAGRVLQTRPQRFKRTLKKKRSGKEANLFLHN